MTRLQATWARLFVLLVMCSLFLATTAAYALNDPK
jgi:hypothetical protein